MGKTNLFFVSESVFFSSSLLFASEIKFQLEIVVVSPPPQVSTLFTPFSVRVLFNPKNAGPMTMELG
jgi:hypothetical protein